MAQEQRKEPRFSFNKAWTVKVIGDYVGECSAQILDYSKSGLSLLIDSSVPLANGAKLEVQHWETKASSFLTIAWSSISNDQTIAGGCFSFANITYNQMPGAGFEPATSCL